jgi:hypothetical protein
MLKALGNVVTSHLLDTGLFDFQALSSGNLADELDAAIGVHGEPLTPALVPVSLNSAL